MKTLLVTLGLLASLSWGFAQETAKSKEEAKPAPTYVGTSKCMLCHKGEAKGNVYEKWLESKHSNAFKVLVDKKDGSEKKPECLACHTTGFNKGGYVLGAENASLYEGVGCESCHGPGSDYRVIHAKDVEAAVKVGFVPKPNEQTCIQCHNKNSPTFKGFNFAEMVKKIDHKYRKAKVETPAEK
ncbi:MAG: multiheme c-type cytochrome [bacterium]